MLWRLLGRLKETKEELQVTDAEGKFWKGAWDGGYDLNSAIVRLGFKIWVSDTVEMFEGCLQPMQWKVKGFRSGLGER